MVVFMTMALIEITIIDFTLPACSSVKAGGADNVKICCSGVLNT